MGGTCVPRMATRVVVSVLVVAVGWSSTAAATKPAKPPKPTISGFSAVPSTVTGPSGYVHLAETAGKATSCGFATTVGATLTPSTVPCSTGPVTSTLFVSENTGKRPVKVHITLTATGPGGTKSAKLVVTVDPDAGGRSLPGAPAGVVATASDGSASVAISPPASTGGEPIESYTVTASDLTTGSNGGQTASGSSSPLTVTGLVDGDIYQFVATATNLIGTGPNSGSSNEVIPDPVPGTPTGITASAGQERAIVSFVPPADASADTMYQVAATDITNSVDGGQTVSGSSSPLTVTGLTDGDRYEFTVQATNPRGSGPLSVTSNPVVPFSIPGTPTQVSAVAEDEEAIVSFVPPGNAGTLTTYAVAASDQTNPTNGTQTVSGVSPVTVTGLTDGDTYTFTVTAVNGTLEGTPSNPSNAVVPSVGNQAEAVQAVQAGQSTYLAAVNADPALAQCDTATSGSGWCSGVGYGIWQSVQGSDTEFYAVGNPEPTFDPTTHALAHLTVQIVGAAYDASDVNGYAFQEETITVHPSNTFLDHVWWSNLESFSPTGDYSQCSYNWLENYNADNIVDGCSPVYFGPGNYIFGPLFTNDSIFEYGDGTVQGSPVFGSVSSPSAVQTADPNCLFVDDDFGMSGSDSNCTSANGEVAIYDATNSSRGDPVEPPPPNDSQLAAAAAANGCLYSGPTQITMSVNGANVGQMTVSSPDTKESTVSNDGAAVTWDNSNASTNYNNCPNNGTANLPANGVVYVQNATAGATVTGANPFDDLVANTATNVTSSPATPAAGNPVVLTATVTSSTNNISTGATVAFSQTTSTTQSGTTTSVISACSSVANWSTPVQVGSNWQSSVTCSTTEATNGTGAFSAAYRGGAMTNISQGNLGQTNTLTPGSSPGIYSQTNAGGCTGCYYGESSAPDAEGDAFVNGNLSGELTVGSQNDVIIDGNLTYADCSGRWTTGQSGQQDFCPYSAAGSNDSLGLVADNYVEVNHPVYRNQDTVLPSCNGTPGALCDPASPTGATINGTYQAGLTIDAAVFAVDQSFAVNNYFDGSSEGLLAVYGSVDQFARGPLGTYGESEQFSGYGKHYTWDPLLDFLAPPDYPISSTPSWTLDGATSEGGATDACPSLLGVYEGTNTNGTNQDGPSITQYCSALPG